MFGARPSFVWDLDGASPVIGTVLTVAITVLLAAAAFYVFQSFMDPGTDSSEEQFFVDQESVRKNGPDDYDTSFTILRINKDEKILWRTISFAVLDPTGSPITNATISYTDVNNDTYVQKGDSIMLQSMTEAYDGATLKVLYKGQLLGEFNISFNAT